MGRIQLEWDIEAQKIEKSDSEDPKIKRERRRNLARLFLLVLLLVGLVAGGIAAIQYRLEDVEKELDQRLRDTIHAEVAALRIGDFDTFINLQRSATNEWINSQQLTYQTYEQLKASTNDIKLTGNVLSTEIEGQRGRAIVEEIINGVPYARVWFYWRYIDGWRHVPPDLTFWGDEHVLETDTTTINYRTVDEQLAEQLHSTIPNWLALGCDLLACTQTPPLTINIVPTIPDIIDWTDEANGVLQVASPYVNGARADGPFDTQLQVIIANKLAEHMINTQVTYDTADISHDMAYLRQAVQAYLVEQFVQVDTNSLLMESIVTQYGKDKLSQLVSLFSPTTDISIIQQVIPPPLGQANLDWRDFISWRLSLENDLIMNRLEADWLNLYDTSNDIIRTTAYSRFTDGTLMTQPVAIDQTMQTAPSGLPQLRLTVRVGSGDEFQDVIVLFNLVSNVWKRAS